jgi:hypothetical protein
MLKCAAMVFSSLRGQRQEEHAFEANLGYKAISRSARITQ